MTYKVGCLVVPNTRPNKNSLLEYMNEAELLFACKKGDRKAQQVLFERFKRKMFAVCLRYAPTKEDAEDMLQEGFIKVFRDLYQYSGVGNFEGWVRKVFVNTALQHLQKHKKGIFLSLQEDIEYEEEAPEDYFMDEHTAQQLLHILQQLPVGFRTVFNLHVLEGYSHPEIAAMLGISVGTSKSQLLRAKAHFKKRFEKSLLT